MDEQVRQGLGERFAARLKARERRRPRMGFAPEFFARLGLDDPWAAPDAPSAEAAQGDGFVFLSAQPYYAMLRRLAASRRRREKRIAEFEARRAGTHMRAAQRRWPGETPMATTRLARLAIDDLILPPPIASTTAPETTPVEESSSAPARWTRRNEPTPAIKSAWLGASHTPARVIRGSVTTPRQELVAPAAAAVATTSSTPDRGEARAPARPALRPLDRAGARAAQPNVGSQVLEQALAAATPAQAARLRRVVEVIEHLPADEAVTVVRRVVRATVSNRAVSLDTQIALATGEAPRASARAGLRAQTVLGQGSVRTSTGDLPTVARNVGLRPVLSRSPAMALAASADTDRAASGTLAEAAHADALPAPRGARPVRARTSVEHIAARERASTPRAASVLPVAVPRVATSTRSAEIAAPAAATQVARVRSEVQTARPMTEAAYAPRGRAAAEAPVSRHDHVAREQVTTPARTPSSAHALARAERLERAEDPRTVAPRAVLAAEPAQPAGPLARLPAAATSAPRSLRTASPGTVLATGASADTAPEVAESSATVTGAPAARSAQTAAARRSYAPATVRAMARDQVDVRSVVPRVTSTLGAADATPARISRTATLAARAVTNERAGASAATPTDTSTPRATPVRAARVAPPDATLALPQAVEPADERSTTQTREARAIARRAQTPMAAHAAQRAATTVSPVAAPSAPSPSTTSTRAARNAPTGPLRFARGLTTMDLARAEVANLDAGVTRARAASRRDTRAQVNGPSVGTGRSMATMAPTATSATRSTSRALPDLGALLARAEAGQASVTGDAVVRLDDATEGAPFVTAREAKRRGLQVVATERGLVATRNAAEVTRGGDKVRAPDTLPARGATRSSARARLDAQHVVPVEVVTASAPARETDTATRSVLTQSPVRTRAAARALARNEVATATAYRGALRGAPALETVRAAPEDNTGAPTTVPTRAATTAGRTVTGVEGRGNAITRRARTPDAGALRTVQSPTAAETSTAMDLDGAGTAGAGNASGTPSARRPRGTFDERMARVAEGRTDGATGWVDRAEGSPRLSTVSSLIQALARASSNEDVVRVIAARGELSSEATRLPLDAPAVQVIQQIRDEVRTAAEPVAIAPTETRASRLSAPEATALSPRALASGSADDSLRRRVRSSAVRSAEASARRATGAEDRLSKLVRRLQDLVHLAEDQAKLAEARGQVRMAEDSAQARSEGQGAVTDSGGARHAKVDIEALGREVLDVVTKELELRRARRMEDDDASPWW